MTKRGGNGSQLIDGHRVMFTGGKGSYTVHDGQQVLGEVKRERHTVRTTYAWTRIGYDRTHTCWHAMPNGRRNLRSSWCHATMVDAARALLA